MALKTFPRPLARCALASLVGLIALGAGAASGDDCAWTPRRDGTETAVCKDGLRRTYCLVCTLSPRVCQRTPC